MDYLNVFAEEISVKVASSSEINQVDSLLVMVIHVVGWVRVALHHLPFKQLTEAKLEH